MPVNQLLIQQCLSEDRKSQRRLYELMLPYLRAICFRYLRNSSDEMDVLQDVFVSIFRKLHTFDPEKGTFESWCARITINTTINVNRMRKRRFMESLSLDGHEQSHEPVIFSRMENDHIMETLKQMPEKYFDVFMLFVVEGYSHKEIAETLKISEVLSRRRLSRSRSWIKTEAGKISKSLAVIGISLFT